MSYREFVAPQFQTKPHNTVDWLTWMKEESVLHEFLPTPTDACDECGQPCSVGYATCQDCDRMRSYIDGFVPASYSLADGLEPLVATYKDGTPDTRWQAKPLGCLLWAMFRKHAQCFQDLLGPDPIYTWVPSNNHDRGFDHLQEIIFSVKGFGTKYPWEGGVIERDFAQLRPGRKQVKPAAYRVTKDVEGRSVLLFDDVWTTGASMISASAALKQSGAATVLGVTLGRQFNSMNNYGSAQMILKTIRSRGWTFDDCSLES